MEKGKTKKSTSASKTNKKPTTKKTVKKTVEKPKAKKVEVKEEKNEKWYIWLKNHVIENEKNLSKNMKYRRLYISLFAIVCFVIVAFSTAIIDYSTSIRDNNEPFFVIRVKNKSKQATVYYGGFYKAWKCYGDSKVNYSRYSAELDYFCPLIIQYDEEGIYTNPNKVKITESEINNIITYYEEAIRDFEDVQDLKIATTVSTELNKLWWTKVKPSEVLNGDPNISIAVFSALVQRGDTFSWELQHADADFHKCVKYENSVHVFSHYDPGTNSCGGTWEPLRLPKDTCELATNSVQYVKQLVKNTKLCK